MRVRESEFIVQKESMNCTPTAHNNEIPKQSSQVVSAGGPNL